MIPPFKYSFSPQDAEEVSQKIKDLLLNQDYLTMGKYGEELEENFSSYNSSPYVLAVNSGTSALEMIFQALNLHGADVAVPANTFTATAAAVIKAGGNPVYIDCDNDLNLSLFDLKQRITDKTKAVVIVHIGGFITPDIEAIQAFCSEKNLLLIEDAAHAIGSTFKGKKAGNFGDASAFSLFSTKVITAGEGGLVVCKEKALYEKLKILRNHGQLKDNIVTERGYNWRMHEFSSILGIVQLRKLDLFIEKRRRIAEIYDTFFSERLQKNKDSQSNFYKYILQVSDDCDIDGLTSKLKEQSGITLAGRVYPVPVHKQTAYQNPEKLPNAEYLCERHICLPVYPDMKEEEAIKVAKAVKEVFFESCEK